MITIIGGSGFIGSSLARILTNFNIDFEILDVKKSELFPDKTKIVNVRNLEDLKNSITGEIVVNLAAIHSDDISNKKEYLRTNVEGAENICKVCEIKKINKIIFTSSVAVYGFSDHPSDEKSSLNPFNYYGISKAQAEKVFYKWHKLDHIDRSLIIVRPTVVFGEGNRGNVYNLLKQISSGLFISIGNGENKKSMAYVENVAAFLYQCIKSKDNFGLYNYVDEPNLSMKELITLSRDLMGKNSKNNLALPYPIGIFIGYIFDILSKISGIKFSISSIRIKKFCASSIYYSSKKNLDNFESPFSLREGLELTIKKEFLDEVN